MKLPLYNTKEIVYPLTDTYIVYPLKDLPSTTAAKDKGKIE